MRPSQLLSFKSGYGYAIALKLFDLCEIIHYLNGIHCFDAPDVLTVSMTHLFTLLRMLLHHPPVGWPVVLHRLHTHTCIFVYYFVLFLFRIKESTIVNFVSRFKLVNLKRSKWWSVTAQLLLSFVLWQSGFMPHGAKQSQKNEVYRHICPSFSCWLKSRALQLP